MNNQDSTNKQQKTIKELLNDLTNYEKDQVYIIKRDFQNMSELRRMRKHRDHRISSLMNPHNDNSFSFWQSLFKLHGLWISKEYKNCKMLYFIEDYDSYLSRPKCYFRRE